MCPACLTSMALMIGGVTTAGGVTALISGKFRAKRRPGNPPRRNGLKEKTP
jgi:hypothetical protein